MPLDLTEAIERAKLLSDDSGLLAQESYDLLTSKLEDTELHAFTMALVDLGIRPRTGKVDDVSRRLLARVLGQAAPEEAFPDEDLREVLENAGISVSKDGKVTFYKSNIPGLYKDRLQALPLETAIQVWEQQLEIADSEKEKAEGLQNTLTQLKRQVQERLRTKSSPTVAVINTTLSSLENYGFDPRSVSKTTQGISKGIEQVFEMIMSSNWIQALPAIENIQEVLEQYTATQVSDYEQNLFIWDALDRLSSLKVEDPASFQATVEGLGGVIARLLQVHRGSL